MSCYSYLYKVLSKVLTFLNEWSTLENMDTKEVLQHFGLNEKQASIYLALLELGVASAPTISKKSGVKRPTTYVILQELRQKGLLTEMPKKSKTLYIAKSPEVLLATRKEQNEEIRITMPEILALYNAKAEKPRVRFYQGEREINELYAEIFYEKEIWFVASIGSIPENLMKCIHKYIARAAQKKTSIREIQMDDPISRDFRKQYESECYQIKTAPKNFDLPSDNAIYGNKIAIFSYKSEPMAVVIESEDVVKTYRSLFEMAWNSI